MIKQREVFEKGLTECDKTNDPVKCRTELKNKTEKINKKIENSRERIELLKYMKGNN